jgi:murein DD-endopeptidase MepM/ murein hydrolase activator NlpD
MSDSSFMSPLHQMPVDMLTSSGNRFEEKVRAAQNSQSDKQKSELKKAAQEFESVFISHMLKVMRETIEESGLTEGGFGKSIYTELFDQEVALNMARHGALGISDLLYRHLSETTPSDEKTPGKVPSDDSVPRQSNPSQASPVNEISSNKAEHEISDVQIPILAPVSSAFGMRKDPFSSKTKFHKGVDLAAPEGMSVPAALPGKVISAGYESGYGNTVLIQHGNGLQTRYGHLGSINVKKGDVVASESVLGTVGNTGRSTGPHLHFEVIHMGKPVDPILNASTRGLLPELSSVNPKTGI